MGATFAVALAQAASTAALRRDGLPVPESFHALLDSRVGQACSVLPYIDDITSVGTSAQRVNQTRDRAVAVLAGVNLHTDPRKSFSAGNRPYEVALGLAWWSDGAINVKPSHALRLFKSTNPIVASKRASPAQLREVIGLWTYTLVLRRPAFSILFDTFSFLNEREPDKRLRLPDSVVDELTALMDVFPLLFADLHQPLSPRIYFSDACPKGGGVSYADVPPRDAWTFKENVHETCARKGWHSTLLNAVPESDRDFIHLSAEKNVTNRPLRVSRRFERAISRLKPKTAIACKWKWEAHINTVETEAALLAVRHMFSSPTLRGARVALLVDNTATLGAVAKGRSSVASLNNICRKIAKVLLSSHISLLSHWVPSELNPADTPSRKTGNVSSSANPGRAQLPQSATPSVPRPVHIQKLHD